jgi:hypothetical protein
MMQREDSHSQPIRTHTHILTFDEKEGFARNINRRCTGFYVEERKGTSIKRGKICDSKENKNTEGRVDDTLCLTSCKRKKQKKMLFYTGSSSNIV